jgi:Transposase zinc-binding domain
MQRHRPEETTLYRVVQTHLDTYIAFVDIETGGAGLPTFVTDEFDQFLACGILAHGFLRLRCNGCKEEKLVAFSAPPKETSFGAQRRGICLSCGTRRNRHRARRRCGWVCLRRSKTGKDKPDWFYRAGEGARAIIRIRSKSGAPGAGNIRKVELTVRFCRNAACLTVHWPTHTMINLEK